MDAVGGILTSPRKAEERSAGSEDVSDSERRSRDSVPDTLVTFGAGINQLVSLKVLSGGVPKSINEDGVNPVTMGMGTLAIAAGVTGWIFWSVRTGARCSGLRTASTA